MKCDYISIQMPSKDWVHLADIFKPPPLSMPYMIVYGSTMSNWLHSLHRVRLLLREWFDLETFISPCREFKAFVGAYIRLRVPRFCLRRNNFKELSCASLMANQIYNEVLVGKRTIFTRSGQGRCGKCGWWSAGFTGRWTVGVWVAFAGI